MGDSRVQNQKTLFSLFIFCTRELPIFPTFLTGRMGEKQLRPRAHRYDQKKCKNGGGAVTAFRPISQSKKIEKWANRGCEKKIFIFTLTVT